MNKGKKCDKIKNDLKMDFVFLRRWFYENHLVLNPDKCHYIVIHDHDRANKLILNNKKIISSNEEVKDLFF